LLEASFLIAASTLAGAISAAVILTRISRRSKTSSLEKKHERLIKPFSTTKAELQSLLFEKSLLSQSITRVYEASYEGKIDSIERDRLLLKYRQQLDSYDKKIADLQSVVDITELVDMRNGLVSLLEGRITAIDQKLAEISNKYGISTSDIVDSSPKSDRQAIVGKQPEEENKESGQNLKENDEDRHQSDVSNEESMTAAVVRGGDQKDKKKHNDKEKAKTEEKTIDELQKEIMHALSRLEQVDPDPDNRSEKNYEPSVDRKRDALISF
jgi:hypothetical protein